MEIQLERSRWTFDERAPLGPPGGFGEVFRGNGEHGDVAVKRLKLSAGEASYREMRIGAALAERDHSHVVPVLDFGQDPETDRYFLVMPICDYSLQEKLASDGALSNSETRQAAQDIVAGLLEVGDLVHRDLKPGNVLWHNGVWKIADFGIAKFVEDATSLQSLRSSLTPAYAAPEQWRGERPTNATDVYALGCIIHAMLTGQPPFTGGADDLREAHLHNPAPPINGGSARLTGMVSTMLRKSPQSRPALARCAKVLSEIDDSPRSDAHAALSLAGSVVAQEEAEIEAEKSAQQAKQQERLSLAKEAADEIGAIVGRLFDVIESATESAARSKFSISLGPAQLSFTDGRPPYQQRISDEASAFGTGWDVVTSNALEIRADLANADGYGSSHYKFGATLVFTTTPQDGEYRWRELSFHEILTRRSNDDQPFPLDPFERDFHVAVSNTMGRHQVAHGPHTIDGEDEHAFQERWLNLFAKAAARNLRAPTRLPLPESFFS